LSAEASANRKDRLALPLFSTLLGSASDRVINQQDDDSSYHCDDQAINIKTRYSRSAKQVENEAADDAQDNVKDDLFPFFVDDFASNKTGKQAKNNPCEPDI
jgi:hypothetical protein